MTDATDHEDTSIGGVTWYSSEEDSRPDVGISVYLGPDDRLWCGEISRKLFEELDGFQHFPNHMGWFIIRRHGMDSKLIAKCADDYFEASKFIHQIATWVRLGNLK
jgi:hypothetical protein